MCLGCCFFVFLFCQRQDVHMFIPKKLMLNWNSWLRWKISVSDLKILISLAFWSSPKASKGRHNVLLLASWGDGQLCSNWSSKTHKDTLFASQGTWRQTISFKCVFSSSSLTGYPFPNPALQPSLLVSPPKISLPPTSSPSLIPAFLTVQSGSCCTRLVNRGLIKPLPCLTGNLVWKDLYQTKFL